MMRKKGLHFIYTIVVMSGVFLQSCTQIDNYMLGKDNTPKPRVLSPIHETVDLKTVWSHTIGPSNKSMSYLKLKPVVVGNTIYIADISGMVQAVDKKDGHLVWSNQVHYPIYSGPTVKEGYVVVGTDSSSLIVMNQVTGHTMWEAHLSEDALAKSVIADKKVFAKTMDGHLYAFDLATGKKRWEAVHGAPSLVLKASSSPVIQNDLLIVGFSDGKLDGIDLHTGSTIWQRSIAYATGASDVERLVDIDADPIVRGNVVYLASYQGYIGALDLNAGQFIWNKSGSVYKNMAIDENTLYITDSKDVLWAFNRQNGQVKWKQTTLKARVLTEPVLMGSHLVVGDKTGYLHVISTQNGELVGRMELGAAITVSPVVSGHTVYVMSANGSLRAISVENHR